MGGGPGVVGQFFGGDGFGFGFGFGFGRSSRNPRARRARRGDDARASTTSSAGGDDVGVCGGGKPRADLGVGVGADARAGVGGGARKGDVWMQSARGICASRARTTSWVFVAQRASAVSSCVCLAASVFDSGAREGRRAGVARARRGRGREEGLFNNPDRVCTDAIMAVTVGTFALQMLTRQALTGAWAKVNDRIAAGEVYRLATPIVLHGGLPHLLVNMYSLHSIGPLVEATFGREQFCGIYVASGVVGNMASFRFSTAPAVGASGSIFGLAGALAVYLHRHKRYLGERADWQLRQLGTALAVNLGFGLTSARIDNWGHMGGLLGGSALAFLTGPNLVPAAPLVGSKTLAGRRGALVNRPLLQNVIPRLREWWADDEDD